MMKTTMTAMILALSAGAALAAPQPKAAGKHAGAAPMACCAKCPMCQKKMAESKGKAGGSHEAHAAGGKAGMGGKPSMGMMSGKPGMGGMMGGKGEPTAPAGGGVAITVTPEGYAYVVRGDVLYKFDADLNLTAQARLGSPPPPKPPMGHKDHGSHPKP